jgi:hypothetical protein
MSSSRSWIAPALVWLGFDGLVRVKRSSVTGGRYHAFLWWKFACPLRWTPLEDIDCAHGDRERKRDDYFYARALDVCFAEKIPGYLYRRIGSEDDSYEIKHYSIR